MKYTQKTHAGFTISEMIIVITVIAILSVATIGFFNGIQNQARETALYSDLENAASQLALDYKRDGLYPENKVFAQSDGTILSYGTDTERLLYCVTASSTASGVGPFYITNSDMKIKEGACSGHLPPL